MSFKKTGSHYDKNLKEWLEHFEAEYESDVSALPEANPGSTCLVKETGKTVVMANNGVWGGGAGGLPIGETTTVKEVLAECQPEFVEGEGVFVLMGESDIAVGEKYTVNWNGADYECVAVSAPNNSIALGNMSAMGGDNTGEPFLIAYNIDASAWSFIDMTGSTTLTISIRQEVTEVKKISGKYVEGMGYDNSIVIYNKEKSDGDVTDSSGVFVKISDTVIPFDMLDKVVMLFSDGMEVTPYWIEKNSEIAFSESVVVVYAAGASFDFDKFGKFTFPETGAYAVPITEGMLNAIKFTAEDIHPIDPKFLQSVTLYYGSDSYIYHDADANVKVTRDELKTLAAMGTPVWFEGTFYYDGAVHKARFMVTAFEFPDNEKYGAIGFVSAGVNFAWYYTAEYVQAGPV